MTKDEDDWDNIWPDTFDLSGTPPLVEIRDMTEEERQRAKEKEKANKSPYDGNKCVSCGNFAYTDFCEFCIQEE